MQEQAQAREGLGQDVSSVDTIGITLVIAGDPSKHPSLALAPIVLSASGTCSGGASRIDANQQIRFPTPRRLFVPRASKRQFDNPAQCFRASP
jgi:hypothetical protein